MAAQLNISVNNDLQTLTSGVAADILDTYLNGTNLSTTRHINLELLRNCCDSGEINIYLPPRYLFTLTLTLDDPYIPGVPTANDMHARFRLGGIDVSYIKTFEVETNADAPTTATFVWKEYTKAIATGQGYDIYYLLGALPTIHQIRITTIDDYVYVLDVTYTWTSNPLGGSTAAAVIVSYPTMPTNVDVDFLLNTLTFDTDDWELTTTDNIFIDGIYQYYITQVETGANIIESVHKFFNIKLRCIVMNYIANNLSDAEIGLLMAAMDLANTCNLTSSQMCALYGRITRKLLLANQISASSPLGCGCGCS